MTNLERLPPPSESEAQSTTSETSEEDNQSTASNDPAAAAAAPDGATTTGGAAAKKARSSSPRRQRPPARARGPRRKAPCPRSVLDHRALVTALDDLGILDDRALTLRQVSNFYQVLHRYGYPPLPEFVRLYEAARATGNGNAALRSTADPTTPESQPLQQQQRNVISSGGADAADDARKLANRIHLPKALLKFLENPDCGFVTLTSRVATAHTSDDGSTTKLVVQLADGQKVESVLMRYTNKGSKKRQQQGGYRASLCVSSQVGCAMGCTFCATGTMGLTGNLTGGEILEQLVHANKILRTEADAEKVVNAASNPVTLRERKRENQRSDHDRFQVRNVVFMGMGEPLDNYDNVVEACRAMIDRKRWNLAHGRVTVSTVGIVPKIRRLTAELPEVSLALSLHAPFQDMRANIVPSAKNFSLESLVDALDGHQLACQRMRLPRPEHAPKETPKRRAMIEYVMLDGPTSTLECAHELGRLCRNRNLTVNLIPYNPTDVKDKLRCPTREHIQEFRAIVASYGSFCTVRRTMGADIASACGQLVQQELNIDKSGGNNNAALSSVPAPRDMEDFYGGHAKRAIPGEPLTSVDTKAGRAPMASGAPDPIVATIFGYDLCEEQRQRLVRYVACATTAAASCFLVTTYAFLKQQARRR